MAEIRHNIVLVHGLWMTPLSWEHWVERFSGQGHNVVTPTYPGFEVGIEALRADPTPIAEASIPETVAHLESVIQGLDSPPILIGHSFGGCLVQLLLDRGHGAAGVVIDSAPTEGVHTTPLSQIKSLFPILSNPANRKRAVGFTPKEFHYAFTNSLTEEESQAVWERYHIAAPGTWVFGAVLSNFTPGHQETWVNYENNDRAPLLFVAGENDHIMPASVNRSNANKYRDSTAYTEFREYPGRTHYICGQPGWEEVADDSLAWALEHMR